MSRSPSLFRQSGTQLSNSNQLPTSRRTGSPVRDDRACLDEELWHKPLKGKVVKKFKLIAIAVLLLCAVGLVFYYWPSSHFNGSRAGLAGPAELYPDPRKTPGAVDPNATEEKICTPGYSSTVRSVSEATKRRVYESYGVAESQRHDADGTAAFEVDHFISLELGGSNDESNLWPEPYNPKPGARQKDVVENWLHRQVCVTHTMTLKQAQEAIRTDWYKVYLEIRKQPRKRKRAGD
jgi:hypothetical protein